MTRSGSREKYPSTAFVIETLKEKHKILEEKLGQAYQRVESAATRLSNTDGSLMNNSMAQNRDNYPQYESKDVPVIGGQPQPVLNPLIVVSALHNQSGSNDYNQSLASSFGMKPNKQPIHSKIPSYQGQGLAQSHIQPY